MKSNLEHFMFKGESFNGYAHIINKKCISSYYQEIYINFFFLVCLIGLTHAFFNSNQKVVTFFNIDISLYYFLPWVLCVYEFPVSFYKIYFVKGRRFIKNINVDKNLEIKLFNGKVLKLESFTLILDSKKIDFENTGSFGEKVYKKYDFDYIGIKSNETTYLLPYKKESKDFTVRLLESISQ